MKKAGILLVLSIVTIISFGQITITDTDMPSVNDTIRFSETIDIQGLDPSLTGTNFSWDFSTLTSINQRVDTFVSVSSVPFAYQFYFNNQFIYPNHKASYALRGVEFNLGVVSFSDVFDFFKNSSAEYSNVGFGSNISGIPSSTRKIPVDVEFVFPLDYNDNNISNSEFETSIPTVGVYGQKQERIDTVDGWGSLLLPNKNYTNVLRVKSILNKTDTTYLDILGFGTTIPRPEEIEYKWLANGEGLPVLKIVTNAGIISQIEYRDTEIVGIAEKDMLYQIGLFPNPAKTHLIIDFNSTLSGELKINLKDITGKDFGFIYNDNVSPGNNKLMIDLAQYSLASGVYFIELLVDDKKSYTKKLVIAE
jgi:Secretion system C-terminal sorting domain